ncbi:MAG: ABC transporter permease subunit [Pseudohongiellaceae bacterium]
MDGFITALKAEWFVALRSNTTRILVLLPMLVVLVRLLLVKLAETGAMARDALIGNSGFGGDPGLTSSYGYLVDGFNTGITLLGLTLAGQAAYSFAYDRDTGLIRHLLIRRCSRTELTLAKLVHLLLMALLSLLLLLVSGWLVAGMLWEYGPVVEDGYELISMVEIHREIVLGLQLAVIPLPAVIAFGLLVSVLAQSAAQALSVALGVTLAVDVFKSLLGDAANYLYATFQPSLLDQSYLGEVSRIVRGYSDVLLDEKALLLNYWVPLPQMIILAALAIFFANRKKI